jgi:hypothetical protein
MAYQFFITMHQVFSHNSGLFYCNVMMIEKINKNKDCTHQVITIKMRCLQFLPDINNLIKQIPENHETLIETHQWIRGTLSTRATHQKSHNLKHDDAWVTVYTHVAKLPNRLCNMFFVSTLKFKKIKRGHPPVVRQW